MSDASITWHTHLVKQNLPSAIDLIREAESIQEFVQIWNTTVGDDLSVSPRSIANSLRFSSVDKAQIVFAQRVNQIIAAAFVCVAQNSIFSTPTTTPLGIIAALAVLPDVQRQGIGSQLLTQAETLLAEAGCSHMTLGNDTRLLLPGVPEEIGSGRFFEQHGYHPTSTETIDSSINIATYQPPQTLKEILAAVRPAQPTEQAMIVRFLDSIPLTSQTATLRKFVENGKRLSDLMLLWDEDGLEGVCHLVFEDSLLPIEIAFPYHLPRPWAFVSTLLLRPQHPLDYAATLLDASLRRLHNTGVNAAVVASLEQIELVEPFALIPYRRYRTYTKHLKRAFDRNFQELV